MEKQERIYNYLEEFLTDHKKKLFKQVIAQRSQHLTVVLENIYQAYNSNAVIRTCDIFGIQDLHLIENEYEFSQHKYVSAGAEKWVDLHRHRQKEHNTEEAIEHLRTKGYKIVVTRPNAESKSLYDIELDSKIALVFGNELKGVSELAQNLADETIYIPMNGFTESLNISVSVALTLQYLTRKMKSSNIPWEIEGEDKYTILVEWAKKCIPKAHLLEKKFLAEYKS